MRHHPEQTPTNRQGPEMAGGSKESERPLSRFPLRGKAGAGGFPPRRQHAAPPAKAAGTHRAPAPPTRGLPPPCESPASAARRAWKFARHPRVSDHNSVAIGRYLQRRLHKILDTTQTSVGKHRTLWSRLSNVWHPLRKAESRNQHTAADRLVFHRLPRG